MSTNNPNAPETSVMFSLAELAHIEEDRIQEENEQRRLRALEVARVEQAEQAAQREAEAARVAAEIERRQQAERDKAEKLALETAREAAAVEVARIEAESRSRLEAENAARKHELDKLRLAGARDSHRVQRFLGGALALALLGGAAGAWAVRGHVNSLAAENQQLRGERWAVSQTHEQALSAELASLERRHDDLKPRAAHDAAELARVRAEAARSAIEAGGVDAPGVRAFSASLDGLADRVALVERIAAADRRFADLSRWATTLGRGSAMDDARQAAVEAHKSSTSEAVLARYEASLDRARAVLESEKPAPRIAARPRTPKTGATKSTTTGGGCANPHDPMCGLDGQMLSK